MILDFQCPKMCEIKIKWRSFTFGTEVVVVVGAKGVKIAHWRHEALNDKVRRRGAVEAEALGSVTRANNFRGFAFGFKEKANQSFCFQLLAFFFSGCLHQICHYFERLTKWFDFGFGPFGGSLWFLGTE